MRPKKYEKLISVRFTKDDLKKLKAKAKKLKTPNLSEALRLLVNADDHPTGA